MSDRLPDAPLSLALEPRANQIDYWLALVLALRGLNGLPDPFLLETEPRWAPLPLLHSSIDGVANISPEQDEPDEVMGASVFYSNRGPVIDDDFIVPERAESVFAEGPDDEPPVISPGWVRYIAVISGEEVDPVDPHAQMGTEEVPVVPDQAPREDEVRVRLDEVLLPNGGGIDWDELERRSRRPSDDSADAA